MEIKKPSWYREFTQPFDLIITGEKISWVPGSLDLVYDPLSEKARAIEQSLDDYAYRWSDGLYISVTPVGPQLTSRITDPYTFVWAANALYGDTGIEVQGDAPTLQEMGLGGGDYDKNKNPRIY